MIRAGQIFAALIYIVANPVFAEHTHIDITEYSISAITQLDKYQHPLQYCVYNAFDNDPASAWVEGLDGSAQGYGIHVAFGKAIEIDRLCIFSGYCMNDDTYNDNNSLKKIQIVIDTKDGKRWLVNAGLEHKMGAQFIDFETAYEATRVMVLIDEVYKGDMYDNTAISEILLFSGEITYVFTDIDQKKNDFKEKFHITKQDLLIADFSGLEESQQIRFFENDSFTISFSCSEMEITCDVVVKGEYRITDDRLYIKPLLLESVVTEACANADDVTVKKEIKHLEETAHHPVYTQKYHNDQGCELINLYFKEFTVGQYRFSGKLIYGIDEGM